MFLLFLFTLLQGHSCAIRGQQASCPWKELLEYPEAMVHGSLANDWVAVFGLKATDFNIKPSVCDFVTTKSRGKSVLRSWARCKLKCLFRFSVRKKCWGRGTEEEGRPLSGLHGAFLRSYYRNKTTWHSSIWQVSKLTESGKNNDMTKSAQGFGLTAWHDQGFPLS